MCVSSLRPFCSGNWGKKGDIQLTPSTSFDAIVPHWYGDMRPLAVTPTCRILLYWKQDKMQIKP